MLESNNNNLLVSHYSQLNNKTQERTRKEQSLTLLEAAESCTRAQEAHPGP